VTEAAFSAGRVRDWAQFLVEMFGGYSIVWPAGFGWQVT
jgi:hypothetical protein